MDLTAKTFLDAVETNTTHGARRWPLGPLAKLIGVDAARLAATLPAAGPASPERITVIETESDGGKTVRTVVLLSVLAAYTASVALSAEGVDSAEMSAHFAAILAGSTPLPRTEAQPDQVGEPCSTRGWPEVRYVDVEDILIDPESGIDPELPERLILSDYLYSVTGNPDFAERFKAQFGKAVKAEYVQTHGRTPPTEEVDIDGRDAVVCVYTEDDRPLIDRVWAVFERENRRYLLPGAYRVRR